jgi:hypothetical protein
MARLADETTAAPHAIIAALQPEREAALLEKAALQPA